MCDVILDFVFFSNAVASKIMAKMGYKSGEGLGRDNQGMSTALMVEKTSKRGGKIIHERDIQKGKQLLTSFFHSSFKSKIVYFLQLKPWLHRLHLKQSQRKTC